MSLMSRRLYYLCITVLVSLAYIETATGQATEIVTTIATAWITETIDVLDLNPPVNVELKEFPSNNTAFSVTWNHTTDLNVTYDIVVTTPDGSEDEQREVNKMSGYIITDKAPGQEYNVTVVALDTSNSKDASSDSQLIRLSPNAVDNLERKYSNNTHVQAQWDKPSGEVSGYNVTCSPGVPLKAEIKDENETEAFCYGDDIAGMAINMTVVTISVGKSSVPAYVTIQANPNPVLNLMESDANTTSVTATWTAPIGEVEYYEVNCSNGSVVSSVVEDGNQYEASCTGMIAGDTIMVTVTSISNSARSSPESVPITAFPNPVVLMDSDASTDSVTVTWVTPVGTFDSYKGVCSNGSLDDLTLSSTSATCRGVTPGNVVTVTVTTVSGLKESPDDVNVTAIPNAVENLMESDATTTNVTVMWTSPGGIFDGYSVDCSNGSLDGSLTRDSTEATCVGVTAGNVVTVTVTTNSGTKINSDSENVTALPYMVLNLIEKVATMETIEASWQFPGGFVSTYSVSCSNGTANPPEVNENNSGEYSSVCEGLPTPGDNYTMTVTAVSEGTPGAADTVQITAVPSSPVLLGLPSSVENVSASWNHPKGIVDSFEVNCKPADISTPVQSTIDAGSSNSFQAACTVERPGELFSLSVTSVSGSKTSSESVEPLRALPEAVKSFSVRAVTTNMVELEWTMKVRCQNDGCVWSSFNVSRSPDFSEKNVPHDNTSTSFTSQTPGKSYTFTIIVLSQDEESSPVTVVGQTKPNIVKNLRRNSSSNTSVTAVWDPPLNSVFDSYTISCSNGTASPMIIMKDETTEASCTGVSSGRLETITVTTVSGSRSNSDDLDIWSKPNTVKDLEGDGATSSSVSVTWSLPGDHIPSYYYIISCSDGNPVPSKITDGATTATCSPVTAGSLVTVSVTTHSGEENNTDSTTVRGKPNSVVELTEEDATTASVTASWKRPVGDVTHYDISCSTGNPRPPVQMDDGRTNKYSATCENIPLPGTECTMTVTSFSDDVAGDSRLITITARPIPPMLEEAASTVTSISVEWVKPNSVVDYYIIGCANSTASSSNITNGTLSASCTGLTVPGDLYYISVQSQSKDKLSDKATKSINASPANVVLVKSQSLVDTVNATWMDPGGVYEEFNIQCEPAKKAKPSQETIPYDPDASSYEAECNVSIPGDLYIMTVVSRSGSQNSSLSTLGLRALPEAVKTFTVGGVTTNSVILRWTMQDKCLSIDSCVWSSFLVSHNPGSVQKDVSKNKRSTSFPSLTPGEKYTFSITVLSHNERSSTLTTERRTIPEAVKKFSVSDVTTNLVELEWTVKDRCQNNGCVWTSFNVSHNPDFSEQNVMQNVMSTSFTSLTPGESYTFTIIVLSQDEESSPESAVERTIPETVDEFIVSNYSTDFVQLSWTTKDACKDNGCVWDKYKLTYTSDGDSEQQPGPPLDSSDVFATVSSLIPGERYNFFITVVSGQKESSAKPSVQRTKPETVGEFKVESYLTDSVMLNWTIKDICENDNCVWDTYNISYAPSDDDTNGGESVQESKNISSTEISRLTPGESYDFFITVLSGDEESDYETVVQRTKPETVGELKVESYLTDSVMLSWTIKDICENDNCVWDTYNILYAPSGDTNGESVQESKYISSAEINGLTPGESYDFFITVLSGDEESDSKTDVQRTSPEPVEMFEVTNYTDNGVTLSWMMKAKCENDNCVWTSFEISYNSTLKDNIPKASTSLSVDSLTPGAEYHFSISVISFDEPSTSENTIQRLKPSSVGLLEKKEVTETKAIIEWTKPDGEVTGYDTTIESMEVGRGGGETGGFDGNLGNQKHTATFENLTPGLSYEITVCTESYNERCITRATITIDTLPALPSAPLDVLLQDEDIHTVIVTFSEPEFPNGDIMEYIIRYSGVKGGSDDQEEMENSYTPEEEEVAPYSVPVDDLVAGYTYTFEVSAINDEGEGTASDPKHITLDELEPEVPVITPTKGSAGEPGVHSFKIEFNPDIFTHCNGELLTYTVLVVEDSAYDENDGTATSGKGRPDTFSYDQAQNGAEYQAFEEQTYPFKADYSQCGNTASRKKRQTDEPMIVPIGDESCSGGYCNGKLHGNRNYRVKFRAFNAVGYADSAYSEPIETKLNHVSWVIPFLFVVIILVAFGLVYLRRKERNKPGSVPLFKIFKFKDGGATNDGFVPDKPMRRTGDTRPIKLAAFGNHLEDMSRDSDYLFSEEYNDLRPVGKNQSTDAAQLEVNRVKNRFSNILPYDHTRVKLDEIDDEEGSDYINANYMLGYISNREYIACQGPLQSTEEDMWRLVWEQGASLIVMVTQLMENGKIKCHQYWPDEGEGPVRYGEIVVNPSGVEHEELWTKRNFQITKGPATRNVAHFNFLAWPDHGVPEKPDDLIRFVQAVRTCKKLDGKPAVVHCSAGVGRTGTFISLDNLMTAMKDKDEVDIFGMVRNMRMNRCLMVQTESQYIFIHQCVMALLEGGPSSSDSEAVYENVNGNGGYYQEALI